MAYDRYPAVDENFDFPPEVRQALAESAELRNTVLPLTQTQRNNLTGADLWDGRLVLNTTTDRLNRYDGGTSIWKVIADVTDITASSADIAALDARLDSAESLGTNHESRLDTLDTGVINGYTAARVRSTSAGVQDNGFGRKFFDTGYSFRTMPPVVTICREVSGTMEVDSKVVTGFGAGGVVYVTGGDLTTGLPHLITVID